MQGKKIKTMLIYKDLTITDLASKLGKSPQNLSNLLKKDNFREQELEQIADALGCDLRIEFVDRQTGKIF